MPIEIRELHIKAVIDSGGGKSDAPKPGAADGTAGEGGTSSSEDMQQIVERCVEKVLEILKEKTER